ncbi:MAG: ABC transporter permease [Rhodobacterales bacterium]|nr:ABC transporter permease [Rhodobacterales bacterium]
MAWSSLKYLPGQIGLALVVFGIWEGLVQADVLSVHIYGYPSGIAAKVWGLLSTGELFRHAAVTAFAAVLGFVLGSAIGSFAGLCLWLNETVARIVRPFIVAINGVPKIAFAPLIIVWFGIGIESKIAIAAALTFIVSLIATYNGTLETDRDLLRLMRSLGATRLQAWRKVVVPAALPWILSTLRLNVGFALIGAVVGEYISSQEGLGYLVYYSGVLYDLNGVWAGIIALMVVALLVERGVTEIDRRLRW